MSLAPPKILAAVGALALLTGLLVPRIADAEEFKLVLTPEGDQQPPARVCLASRSRAMRADRGTPGVSALSERVRCADGRCLTDRDTPPARCTTCPASPHPECAGALEMGRWAPEAYTVVCADDNTAPAAGGTVYIAVETVEAMSPPHLGVFEVSGGRVRWSPFGRMARPSYRVLGGDFEASRFSYPRVPSEQPWVEVPLRRRCRCLDARVSAGSGPVIAATVDEQPTCRAEAPIGGMLPVEVPAASRDRVRALRIEQQASTAAARWSTRWPSIPVPTRLERFDFGWTMPCTWPRPERCPTPSIPGAQCSVEAPVDGRCAYRCRVLTDGAVDLPTAAELHLEDPPIHIGALLGAVGQTLIGQLPPDSRTASIAVGDWPRATPGARLYSVEVLGADGARYTVELDGATDGRLEFSLPQVRCGMALRVDLVGERRYRTAFGRVTRGAKVVMAQPDELAIPISVQFSAGLGWTSVIGPRGESTEVLTQASTPLASIGVRVQPPASRWFGEGRLLGAWHSAWPYGPLSTDAEPPVGTHPYLGIVGEFEGGYMLLLGSRTVAVHAGAGIGRTLDGELGQSDAVESERLMGTVLVAASTPMLVDLSTPLWLRVGVRHWFGSRALFYSRGPHASVIRKTEPVHGIMLSGQIVFGR